MKKTIPLLILLLSCFIACQKKDKNVSPQGVAIVDTGYYPPLRDTAYYSGLDSFNALSGNYPQTISLFIK